MPRNDPTPTSDVNPWMALHRGDVDPLYAAHIPQCHEYTTSLSYICTRAVGHPGLHVASYATASVCCDSWGTPPPHLRLPEGF